MEQFTKGCRVLIRTGYMDYQCHLAGSEGRILARVGERYLVKDEEGNTCYCTRSELLRLPKD